MISISESSKEKIEIILRLHKYVDVIGRSVAPSVPLGLAMMKKENIPAREMIGILNMMSVELEHCGIKGIRHDLTYSYKKGSDSVSVMLWFNSIEEYVDTLLVLAGF